MNTEKTTDSVQTTGEDSGEYDVKASNPVFTTVDIGSIDVKVPSERVQDIITQSDRNGNTRAVLGPYDTDEPDMPPQRRTFFRYFCCFFPQNRRNDNGRGKDNIYSLPSSNRRNDSTSGLSLVKSSPRVAYPTSNNYINRPLPVRMPDIGELAAHNRGKKCLALDLDETLVHSSFQPVSQAHYVIPVSIDGITHNVFVTKRPGVEEFLSRVSPFYEIIVFTASLSKYADPLLDRLDTNNVIYKRLFRENCVFHEGHYVKDLSLLRRDLGHTIIVDNSPTSYKFHPENAIDCMSFIDDPSDKEMWQIADFLIGIKDVDDVRAHCRNWRDWNRTRSNSAKF